MGTGLHQTIDWARTWTLGDSVANRPRSRRSSDFLADPHLDRFWNDAAFFHRTLLKRIA